MSKIGEIIKNKNNQFELVMFPDNKIFNTREEAEKYLQDFFTAPGYQTINFDLLLNR